MTSQPEFKKGPKPQDTVLAEPRRYLVNIDSISTHQLFTDCLVIGAGIARRARLDGRNTEHDQPPGPTDGHGHHR